MDSIDVHILDILQQRARLTNLKLAEEVSLSPAPCLRRVRRLEEDGTIMGYGAHLNRKQVGLEITVFVSIRMELHREIDVKEFTRKVATVPEVVSCYLVSGEYDFLLEVVASDLEAYRNFTLQKLSAFAGIKDIHSTFVIGTVKNYKALPLSHLE